jgi:hypothetical protein
MTTNPYVAPADPQRQVSTLRVGPPDPPRPGSPQSGPPDAPEPPEVGLLIGRFNAQNPMHEDLWTRVLHGADAVINAIKDKRQAEARANELRVAHAAIQAEDPDRRAPRTRQFVMAGVTVMLDAVACNFAAQALGNDQLQTAVWTALFLAGLASGEIALDHYRDRNRKAWRAVATGLAGFVAGLGVLRYSYLAVGADSPLAALVGAALFTVATGVFVAAGYWALRRAETPRAARARRLASRAEKEARASRERLARRRRDRDRLVDAYVVRFKACLLQGQPVSQMPAIETALRAHLIGEEPGE